MPSFDIVSEIDIEEVRNASDQARREVATRFDFKGTDSKVDLNDKEMSITLESSTDDRILALKQVLEEKLVKRSVSLKSVEFEDPEPAASARLRIKVSLKSGIDQENAKKLNVMIKEMKIKGIQSSNQGEKIRVTGKKRDTLQETIAALKESNFPIPLQFENFRD